MEPIYDDGIAADSTGGCDTGTDYVDTTWSEPTPYEPVSADPYACAPEVEYEPEPVYAPEVEYAPEPMYVPEVDYQLEPVALPEADYTLEPVYVEPDYTVVPAAEPVIETVSYAPQPVVLAEQPVDLASVLAGDASVGGPSQVWDSNLPTIPSLDDYTGGRLPIEDQALADSWRPVFGGLAVSGAPTVAHQVAAANLVTFLGGNGFRLY